MYRDWSSGNQFDRAWYWMLCNEPFYYWQTGAPPGQDSIASRLITPQYYRRQCPMFFPGFSGPQGGSSLRERQQFVPDPEVASLNDRLGGWNISGTQRLLFVNGYVVVLPRSSVQLRLRPPARHTHTTTDKNGGGVTESSTRGALPPSPASPDLAGRANRPRKCPSS